MPPINRRHLLTSLAAFGGSGMLAGCGHETSNMMMAAAGTKQRSRHTASGRGPAWEYTPVDPAGVAQTAYRIYPDGGCMYAVVGSVISELAKKVGEPFRSFPFEMMRFGDGGVGGWGSLCGVVNGGAALIGLFHREKSKETREELITELCVWYETTPLPRFEPAEPQWADEAQPNVAGSVLCHVSTAAWSSATGFRAFSMEKKERCRRLATDGAIKVVEILNRKAETDECDFAGLTPDVKSCVDCHGPKELGDAMGKMDCAACHQFDKEHP